MDEARIFKELLHTHYNAFIYVLEGDVKTGDVEGSHGTCILFCHDGAAMKVSIKKKAGFLWTVVHICKEHMVAVSHFRTLQFPSPLSQAIPISTASQQTRLPVEVHH